jgi:thiol-disulfide isomerase/thioredoxin
MSWNLTWWSGFSAATFLRGRVGFCVVVGWLLATAELLGASGASATPTNAVEFKVGDMFPDLKGFSLDGKIPKLKGQVAVVDFWGSWCAPCQRTFPVMEDLYVRFRKQGLVILAINVDKSRVAMEEFLKEHPVTFNVVRDSKRELVSRLKLPSLPCTFVLDREGRIHSIGKGFFSSDIKRKHIQLIEKLLADPQAIPNESATIPRPN